MIDEALATPSAKPWQRGREILLASLREAGLPRRLQNALYSQDCSLVGQLIQLSEDDLRRMPAMGEKTILDTQRTLSQHSLELGTLLPAWDQAAALEARANLAPEIQAILIAPRPENPDAFIGSEILLATLDEAGLPQRFVNQMPDHGCALVGQLVQWSEEELGHLSNLGSRSISDATTVLARYGLTFGMRLEDWDDAAAFQRREDLVQERRARCVIADEPTVSPDIPEELLLASLEEMGLPKRFLNHLPAQGCSLIGQLIQKTQAELFGMPNFGHKSVREAREILASHGLSFGLIVPGWNDQTAMVRRAQLGDRIRQVLFKAQGNLFSADGSESDIDAYLEDEARSVFRSVEHGERNVGLLMSLLGFDGHPPKTLETVGQTYQLTRERVRQIGDRARVRFASKWRPTPRLDAAIRLLEEMQPTGASQFMKALSDRELALLEVHPQAVIEFAEFIGKKVDVRRCMIGSDEVFCREESETFIRLCAHELRRATSAMGCTSLDRLAVVLGVPLQETDRIRTILENLSETVWLGNAQHWVMSSRPSRNRVANMAEKIFAVTETITLPELRRCLSRSYRLATVPVADALTDLLELKGMADKEGDSVRRRREVSTDCLGSIELPFLLAFREHGSPLSREQLEDVCIDQYGVHPTSFWISLSYSPIVVKLAPGVYSLAGAHVPVGAVEDVRLRTKASQTPSEYGWTQTGQLWCVIQIDRISIKSGSRAIPTYVGKLTEGSWTCNVSGGLCAGAISVENGFARGLALAFNLAGAENGDLARFSFDLQRRSVELRVGGSELMENATIGPAYYEEVEDEAELDVDDDPIVANSA